MSSTPTLSKLGKRFHGDASKLLYTRLIGAFRVPPQLLGKSQPPGQPPVPGFTPAARGNKAFENNAFETKAPKDSGLPTMIDPSKNSATPAESAETVAVVIGGLTLVRCLGMQKIPYVAVTATGDQRDHFIRHSRYCREGFVTADPKQNPQKALADLMGVGMRQKSRSPLYYGKDQDQRLVSENREELSKYFDFLMPDAETVDICLDKAKFSAYSRTHDLPIPETFSEEETVERLRNNTPWKFPLALKPSSHVTWKRAARKSASRARSATSGSVERTPLMRNSAAARTRRAMAFSRSSAQTISFARSAS